MSFASTCGFIARFPADNSCGGAYVPFGASDQTRGASLSAALQGLNALSPLALDDSSATLSWTFSSTERSGCAYLDSPPRIGSIFSFPARASLRSSDGQIDGGFDVSLSFTTFDGVMGLPSVQAAVTLSDLTATETAVRDFGIQTPLDFSGFASGLLSFRSERQGDEVVGSLSATGVNPAQPSCQQVGGVLSCGGTGGPVQLYGVSWSQRLP